MPPPGRKALKSWGGSPLRTAVALLVGRTERERGPGMSHPAKHPLRDRIEVDFVEADVEMAFNLVDMAEAEVGLGNSALASHAIESAEDVFSDIEQRLARMAAEARTSLATLAGELRREIDLAKPHHSRANRKAS